MSVVVPTRDRQHELLARSLPSALEQHKVRIEVVLVDDGSKIPVEVCLHELRDERIRVIRHESPRGLAAARNTGIAQARGDWIAFLDDDDVWAPTKLEEQLRLAASSEAGFVYSPALYVNATGNGVGYAAAPDTAELVRSLLTGWSVPAGGSNVMVRAGALRQAGGFDPRFHHLGDFECWLRVTQLVRAEKCDQPLIAYFQHPTAMHLADPFRLFADIRRLRTLYRDEYRSIGDRFDGERFLVWVAERHRAASRPRKAATVYAIAGLRYAKPGDLCRGGALLFGERAINALQRVLHRGRSHGRITTRHEPATRISGAVPVEAPPWLVPYLSRVEAPES